jgi:predicted RNA binding protein YcfA (HicA-like mRNA interferase family)
MKIPRDLSGQDLIKLLVRHWGYRQVGSHIILETDTPTHQRLAVPNHKTLRIGTLNGILRAVAQHKRTTREDMLRPL